MGHRALNLHHSEGVIAELQRANAELTAARQGAHDLEAAIRQLTALIEDNGIGFDPATAGRGRIGLVGMIERVALVEGTVMTETEPGKGTTIIACVPLHRE